MPQYDSVTGETTWNGVDQYGNPLTVVDRYGQFVERSVTFGSNDAVVTTRWDELDAQGNPSGEPEREVSFPGAVITGEQIGNIFGSSLGNVIAGDNVFAQVAAGSALSTVLINVGQSFDLYANGSRVYSDGSSESLSFEEAGGIAFDNIDVEFGAQIRSSGVGFAASFLTAELADEIGLDGRPRVAQKWEPVLGSTTRANNGFGDQLFTYAAGTSRMRYVGMTRNFGGPEEMITNLQVDDLKTHVFPTEDIRTIALSKDGTKEVKVV